MHENTDKSSSNMARKTIELHATRKQREESITRVAT